MNEKRESRRRRRDYRPLSVLFGFGFALTIGCADTTTTGRSRADQRQDAAMNDPFGYGPQDGKGSDVPSVSGGKTSEFDKKSFKRDVNRVFNP